MIMNKKNPRWDEFLCRLDGKEGCNFRKIKGKDGLTWTCDSKDRGRPLATKILKAMGLTDKEIKGSMKYFDDNGGHCDCEILFNVAE